VPGERRGRAWVLLAVLLALILPHRLTYWDESLNILLMLGAACLGIGWLWFDKRGSNDLRLPWLSLPLWVLAGWLAMLWGFGVAGYQPQFFILRYFLGGLLIVLSFNLCRRLTPAELAGALCWLMIVIALVWIPASRSGREFFFSRGTRYAFTFSNSNLLACLLVLTFPVVFIHSWLRNPGGLSRLVSVTGVLAVLFVLAVNRSRMALILIIVQAVVLTAVVARLRFGKSLQRAGLVAGGAGAMITVLIATIGREWFAERFLSLWADRGDVGRWYMWQAVAGLFAGDPLRAAAGHGGGAMFARSWEFPVAQYEYLKPSKGAFFTHNQLLDWSLEAGAAGLLCFLAFAGLLLWSFGHALRKSSGVDPRLLRAAYLLAAAGFLLFGQVSVANQRIAMLGTGAILLGAMLAAVRLESGLLPLPRAVLPALAAVAMAGIALHLPAVTSDALLLRALRLKEAGHGPARVLPVLRRSTDHNRDNVHAWYFLMGEARDLNRTPDVEEAFARIEALAPNLMESRPVYAHHMAATGHPAMALDPLDRYLAANAYAFPGHCQYLLYAHHAGQDAKVVRGFERLLRAAILFLEASDMPAPRFDRTTAPDGHPLWVVRWNDAGQFSAPEGQLLPELVKGTNRHDLQHDYLAIRRNARRILRDLFGFKHPGFL